MMTSAANRTQHKDWLLYAGLLAVFAVVIAGGYFTFREFAINVMPEPSAYSLLALSVIAGTASFFSPCAFPLLPGYFSFFYSQTYAQNTPNTPALSWARLGFAAALGVVSFNIMLGIVIGLFGAGLGEGLSISASEPSTFVRFFRGAIGLVLMILGLAQLKHLNLKPMLADVFALRTRPQRKEASPHPVRSLYLYGLGYNAAGMGCTGPILAGLSVFAFGSGGFTAVLSAFLVFSATMAGFMILVSVLVAASQDALIYRLKAATSRIKFTASALLIGVGAFNVATTIELSAFTRTLFP